MLAVLPLAGTERGPGGEAPFPFVVEGAIIMRAAAIAVLTLLIAAHAWAAEPWFLPYEPDADTLLLLHLDAEGAEQPDAGPLALAASLRNDATVIDGVFGRAAELDGHMQFIHVDGTDDLRLGVDQPFTVECWLRPDSTGGNIFSISINYYLAASFTKDLSLIHI